MIDVMKPSRSMICLPVKIRGTVMGVLQVGKEPVKLFLILTNPALEQARGQGGVYSGRFGALRGKSKSTNKGGDLLRQNINSIYF